MKALILKPIEQLKHYDFDLDKVSDCKNDSCNEIPSVDSGSNKADYAYKHLETNAFSNTSNET